MNKTAGVLIVLGLLCGSVAALRAQAGAPRVRLGTYDNRAIAVAYAPSRFNPVAGKVKEREEARKAGDDERVAELEAWGEKHQRQLHRQGFARVPVDDLLAHVKDRLAEVARERGLDAIVWTCDHAAEGVEVVDVTDDLVQLFEPSAKTLATIAEVRKHAPADLDEVEAGHDH